MTRMLFWNIEQFKAERFYNASGNLDPVANMTHALSSTARHDLMYAVIEAANPDVIVIVEVTAAINNASNLAGNNGGTTALLSLLDWLRNTPSTVQSPEWRLVPPLWIAGANNGGLETVGVLYRGVTGPVTRYFTGPNLWPGGVAAVSKAPPGLNGPYGNNVPHHGIATDYRFMLMPGGVGRNVPVGALHNATLPEGNLAARYKMNPIVPVIAGPGVSRYVNFGACRPPYMVTFTEDNAGALRNLTVFAIHGPADAGPAQAYIAQLATVEEIAAALGANETRVIGGDFNNNLLDGAGNLNASYNPLTGPVGYQLLLQPAGAAPVNLDSYLGYFATHLLPVHNNANALLPASKFLWSNGALAQSYYPRYGYQSALYYSLDNVLVRPHVALHNYQSTILNTIVASPLNAVLPPVPGNPPIGTLAIAAQMPNIPVGWQPWPPAPVAPDYAAPDATTLLAWDQYGHVASTSDHFALFVDV